MGHHGHRKKSWALLGRGQVANSTPKATGASVHYWVSLGSCFALCGWCRWWPTTPMPLPCNQHHKGNLGGGLAGGIGAMLLMLHAAVPPPSTECCCAAQPHSLARAPLRAESRGCAPVPLGAAQAPHIQGRAQAQCGAGRLIEASGWWELGTLGCSQDEEAQLGSMMASRLRARHLFLRTSFC